MKMKIAMGKNVKVKYSLWLNDDQEPVAFQEEFTFRYGLKEILPSVERNLEGRFVNDTVDFVVPVEEGYGLYREEQIETLKLEGLTDDIEVGDILEVTIDGEKVHGWVQDILDDERYTINFNPPLAGNSLRYEMTIVEIS